ncbi:MAG: helix-turn-helix domain-containing protein [Dehalococcoidia bacterium]
MVIQCPHCGKNVVVNGLGRKRLNMPLKNVYEALARHKSVRGAAHELGCSQGYIYNTLKANGVRLRDVLQG